jgi:T3SS negative regulator,GrlR
LNKNGPKRLVSFRVTPRCWSGWRDIRGQPAMLTLRVPFWHNRRPTPAKNGGRNRGLMKNGLYSIHVSLQDGRSGKGSGVVVFRDGKILGGDAYLFYTGSYTTKGDTFKGEVLVQRHTSSPDANPLFGGPNPVGIGVSGTFTDTAGVMNGTALVGKASQIFKATLRRLAETE